MKEIRGKLTDMQEELKTITCILEEVRQEMCDNYCKYPTLANDEEGLLTDDGLCPCIGCPLDRL